MSRANPPRGPERVRSDRTGRNDLQPGSVLFLDPKLLQLCDACLTGSLRLHFLVNREDLAVGSNVERPSIRELTFRRHHAVGGGDLLRWITEKREVGVLFLGEGFVIFRRVDARHKIGDVVLANQLATRTE